MLTNEQLSILMFLLSISTQTVFNKEMAELTKEATNSQLEVGKVFSGKENA